MRSFSILFCVLALAGCNLAPAYVRPAPAVPTEWPQGTSYGSEQTEGAGLTWPTLIKDPKLAAVIRLALENNQDLHATVASVESARAEYHVERSYELPTLAATADADVIGGGKLATEEPNSYEAGAGISDFELDLFDRLRNQTKSSFETYLATQSGLRSAKITLVAETATAYATLASDTDQLALARQTAASAQQSLALTQSLLDAGLGNAVDVQEAITVIEQANADIANDISTVAQDRNALDLLAGAHVPNNLLPASLDTLGVGIAQVPAGVSSNVLLSRPDVVEAEHELKSSNAAIGTARAAFFPEISLTSTAGLTSEALSDLFTGGALGVSLAPTVTLPIFGGTNAGNPQYAKAQKFYYAALYQKALQSAFEEVANDLARRGTILQQEDAENRLVNAAKKSLDLSSSEYRAGEGDYLAVLTAQRTLYTDQQQQIETTLVDITNRISLYEALGADDTF